MDQKEVIGIVIPASGSGERMGTSVPKQLLPLNGSSVVIKTIEAFLRGEWEGKERKYIIGVIVVVVQEEHIDGLRKELDRKGEKRVVFIRGGLTRHHSIFAGLKELDKHKFTVTVIHDGVRPLVDHDLLEKLVTSAMTFGASGPILKLTATIVSRNAGFLRDVLPRSQFFESHMPQAFRPEIIKQAYESATEFDLVNGTECLDLVRKYIPSTEIKLIEGDPQKLWKITHKRDMQLAMLTIENPFDDYSGAVICHDFARLDVPWKEPLLTSIKIPLDLKFDDVVLKSWNDDLRWFDQTSFNVIVRYSQSFEEYKEQISKFGSLFRNPYVISQDVYDSDDYLLYITILELDELSSDFTRFPGSADLKSRILKEAVDRKKAYDSPLEGEFGHSVSMFVLLKNPRRSSEWMKRRLQTSLAMYLAKPSFFTGHLQFV